MYATYKIHEPKLHEGKAAVSSTFFEGRKRKKETVAAIYSCGSQPCGSGFLLARRIRRVDKNLSNIYKVFHLGWVHQFVIDL